MLFTFVVEKAGGTRIEQVEAPDVAAAYSQWNVSSEDPPNMPADDLEQDPPTPVTGRRNVWCIGGHDLAGVFFLGHIIATAADGQPYN
jgi:hypothetical protein